MPAFPTARLPALAELGSRVLETYRTGSDLDHLARELLAGFFDLCMRSGQDSVLRDLGADLDDRLSLANNDALRTALREQLERSFDFRDLGPRVAKPKQLADCIVAALSLAPTDEPERTITLDDKVRREAVAGLASVIDVELAVPTIRDAIVSDARKRCPEHIEAFLKIAAQLDERGMRITKQLKIPLHAVQAVEQALYDARVAVLGRIVRAAVDRAQQAIARADAAAAARIDEPLTFRITPRDAAVLRVCDPRVTKSPATVVQVVLDALGDLAHLAWRPAEHPVRAYSPKQTFAVGDHIEHPKFGRGAVVTVSATRVEVEFPDGKHTLVHAAK